MKHHNKARYFAIFAFLSVLLATSLFVSRAHATPEAQPNAAPTQEEICDTVFEEGALGVLDEEEALAIQKMGGDEIESKTRGGDHIHTCRPEVIPYPRVNPAAPVVSSNKCKRQEAVNEVLFQLAANECTAAAGKDPQCKGVCGEKTCTPIAQKDADTTIVTCARAPNPGCPYGGKGYVCTAPAGQYKCACKCK